MTEEQIQKAFNGRWRIKGQNIQQALEMMLIEYRIDYVKKLCLDFFRTGILLTDNSSCVENPPKIYANDENGMITILSEDEQFDYWWNLYGKKIDRAKCERKWNKLTLAEKEACIAATPAYVASTPDLQFRRHPMTYLNNKSWENQIIPRNNATNTKPSLEQQRLEKLASLLTE